MGFEQVCDAEPRTLEAWYMDDGPEDQRLPHCCRPNRPVSEKELAGVGVLQWVLDPDSQDDAIKLKEIRKERNYNYEDIIVVSPELPDYEKKIKTLYEEHMHTDEEIRYILDGSGYFDVRDKQDRWIRIWTKKGDMIVLAAGSYHRFTLDECNYIKALRLFIGEPVWKAYNRPQDDHPIRKKYVESMSWRVQQ